MRLRLFWLALRRFPGLQRSSTCQLVRSPLHVQTENIRLDNGNLVVRLTVPQGLDKPYFDKNGVIWLKNGADKRRINSKEELRRLFQVTDQFHADELPTKAGIDKLDKLRFRDFLQDVYGIDYPESLQDRLRLLQNMSLATDEGQLNLAGVLLFAERPQWIKPQFVVKQPQPYPVVLRSQGRAALSRAGFRHPSGAGGLPAD